MALWALAGAAALGGLAQGIGASKSANASAKAAGKAADAQLTATRETNALNQEMYRQNVERQKPWVQAGRGALERLMPMGNPGAVPDFNPGGFEASPGYQFRLNEGADAMARLASARGMRLSGAAIKDANNYAQGQASSEYGNWWNRELDRHNARLSKSNALFNRNAAIAGVGQTATNALQSAGQATAGNIGSANMSGAANVGNALMQAGHARGSAYSGMANAFNNTLGSVGNIAGMAQAGYLGANPGWGITPTHNPYTGAAY